MLYSLYQLAVEVSFQCWRLGDHPADHVDLLIPAYLRPFFLACFLSARRLAALLPVEVAITFVDEVDAV